MDFLKRISNTKYTLCICCFSFISCFLFSTSYSQEIDKALRLNTPFYSVIWSADIQKNGKYFVTSSNKNTATVWDYDNLAKPEVISFPLRNELSKRAHSVAISNNGKKIAYGVPLEIIDNKVKNDSARIYVVFRQSTKDNALTKKRFLSVSSRPQKLKFSPNGNYLAASLSNCEGIKVWDTVNWELQFEFNEEKCSGDTDLFRFSFNPIPNKKVFLVATSDFGLHFFTKNKNTSLYTIKKETLLLDKPSDLDIHESGNFIIVGDLNSMNLALVEIDYDTEEYLKKIYPLLIYEDTLSKYEAIVRKSFIHRVTFKRNINKNILDIYAGGILECKVLKEEAQPNKNNNIDFCGVNFKYDLKNKKLIEKKYFEIGNDVTQEISDFPSIDGVLLVTQRGFRILTKNSHISKHMKSIDYRKLSSGNPTVFVVSNDGTKVCYNSENSLETMDSDKNDSKSFFFYEVNNQLGKVIQGSDGKKKCEEIINTKTNTKGIDTIKLWGNENKIPLINNEEIKMDRSRELQDIYRSYSFFIPNNGFNNKYVALGSSDFINVISINDKESRCTLPITNEAYRIDVSGDSKFITVAHGDGVIRWYRLTWHKDGKCNLVHRLSLYIEKSINDKFKSIIWTAEGYYSHSGLNEGNLLGWQFKNNKIKKTIHPVQRQIDKYYEHKEIVEVFRNDKELKNDNKAPIIISILSPMDDKVIRYDEKSTDQTINVKIENYNPLNKSSIIYKVKSGNNYFSSEQEVSLNDCKLSECEKEIHIKLPLTNDNIEVRIAVKDSENSRYWRILNYENSSGVKPDIISSKLNLITVGFDYPKKEGSFLSQLKYPLKDARDLVNATKSNEKFFKTIYKDGLGIVRIVSNTEIMNKNFEVIQRVNHTDTETVSSLINTLKDKINPTDTTIIYFSGHGDIGKSTAVPHKEKYYLLNSFYDKKININNSVDVFEIIESMHSINGKKILIIDACKTDNFANNLFADNEPLFEKFWNKVNINESANEAILSTGGEISKTYPDEAFPIRATTSISEECDPMKNGLGNGCFTASLVEIVTGKYDGISPTSFDNSFGKENGIIDTRELLTILETKMKDLTQKPKRIEFGDHRFGLFPVINAD